jgi:hypothetical protein
VERQLWLLLYRTLVEVVRDFRQTYVLSDRGLPGLARVKKRDNQIRLANQVARQNAARINAGRTRLIRAALC